MSQKYDLTYYTQEHVKETKTRDKMLLYYIQLKILQRAPIIGTKPKCELGQLQYDSREREHLAPTYDLSK